MKSDVQLNLRAKESQRALIDAAAEILHKSRTDFILEMACKAAENVILDRRVFNFNDEQYAEFIDMLDAPVGWIVSALDVACSLFAVIPGMRMIVSAMLPIVCSG
ncbi:type II toxin-antitoxin system TacA family antitoxin [Klebsiella pneumoniae]